MTGKSNEVQAIIKEKSPAAVYMHCASHCLNLTLIHACELVPIWNMVSIMSEVINFFNDSPKRRGEIEVMLLSICSDARFVQQHDSIIQFANNFQSVVTGLKNIETSLNFDSRPKQKQWLLLKSMERSTFCCFGVCEEAYDVNTSFISNAAVGRLDFSTGLTGIEEVWQTIAAWFWHWRVDWSRPCNLSTSRNFVWNALCKHNMST